MAKRLSATRWGGASVQAVGFEWRAEMVQHPRHSGLPNPMESGYYKLGCRSSLDLLYMVALALR